MEPPEPRLADVDFVEVQCKSALNPVKNMGFAWSLNPYTGCEHRCAFCYVRAFEQRADRPSDDRYGRTIRVKINVAGALSFTTLVAEGNSRHRGRHRSLPTG